MSTPTNIPITPMGETEQDSYFESKEKFQQQLQDFFQTTLRLTRPDQFDQLCQWMKYNPYLTIDDFYESSYNDPEKFDTNGPATEYKWKGKMNYLSPIVAQTLSSSDLLSEVPLKTSPNLRLDPPKGEDQPQDLTSDVFVYGRPNPDGSDNTPPMSIINFDDILGRTFLLPMDENGERKRATISEHVKDQL